MVNNYAKAKDTSHLDVLSLQVIMNCFANAPGLVLSTLGGFLPTFFTEVVKKHGKFKRVLDKKVFILFIGQLYDYANGMTLLECQSTVKHEDFNNAFVNVLETLPEAITKRNKLKDSEENDVEDDDEEENICDFDGSDYTDEYEDQDYFYEDIYFETDLDKFDAYDYARKILTSPRQDSLGAIAISKMSSQQVSKIQAILSVKQEQQK